MGPCPGTEKAQLAPHTTRTLPSKNDTTNRIMATSHRPAAHALACGLLHNRPLLFLSLVRLLQQAKELDDIGLHGETQLCRFAAFHDALDFVVVLAGAAKGLLSDGVHVGLFFLA